MFYLANQYLSPTHTHTHAHTAVLKAILLYFFFFFNLIYFWLRWVSVAARGLFSSCCCLRCGARASHCGGLSCSGARALGTRASVVVAHGLSCSTACGIFPDQGSNPCPLHWQADSQPLRHQGSPILFYLIKTKCIETETHFRFL